MAAGDATKRAGLAGQFTPQVGERSRRGRRSGQGSGRRAAVGADGGAGPRPKKKAPGNAPPAPARVSAGRAARSGVVVPTGQGRLRHGLVRCVFELVCCLLSPPGRGGRWPAVPSGRKCRHRRPLRGPGFSRFRRSHDTPVRGERVPWRRQRPWRRPRHLQSLPGHGAAGVPSPGDGAPPSPRATAPSAIPPRAPQSSASARWCCRW